VSSDSYQKRRHDVVIMAVTSQIRPEPAFGEVSVTEWKKAGLLKPSVTKPILASVEKRLVLRKLGRLAEPDRESLTASPLAHSRLSTELSLVESRVDRACAAPRTRVRETVRLRT